MKRITILFSLLALVMAIAASGASNEFKVGSVTENFTLSDTNKVERSFNELKGEKGTMVVFLSAQCPVVKLYDDRLNKIVADYKDKGIGFIGLNSNSTESLEWVKSHAEEKYKFPMLIDKENIIADKWGASATPQIYLFDNDNKLIYHGAIDNDKSGTNVKSNYLRDALDQHLAGKEITNPTTKAFGCSIKRVGDAPKK